MPNRKNFIMSGDRVKSELNFANTGLELGLNNVLNKIIRDLDAEGPLTGVPGLRQRQQAEKDATTQITKLVDGFIKEVVETSVAKPVEVFADASPNEKFRWILGKVDSEHCPDCLTLSQKSAKTKKEWLAYGLGLPRHGKTECSVGCKCMLVPEDQKKKPSEKKNEELQKDVDEVTGTKNPLLAKNMAGKHTRIKDAEAWVKHNLNIPSTGFGAMSMENANDVVMGFNNIAKKYRTRADLPKELINKPLSKNEVNQMHPIIFRGEKVEAPYDHLNFSKYSNLNKFYTRRLQDNAHAHAGAGEYMGFSSAGFGKSATQERRTKNREASYKRGFFSTRAKDSTLVHEYGHIFSQNHINGKTIVGKAFEKLYNEWMAEKGNLALNYKEHRDRLQKQIKRNRKYLNKNYWSRHDTDRKKKNYEDRQKQTERLEKEIDTITANYRKEAGELQISIYGMTNCHEFVAESFTAYYFGSKYSTSNKYIQEVGKIIDEIYKK